MYNNIGKKIMKLSQILGVVILVICILASIYFLTDSATYRTGFGTYETVMNEGNNGMAVGCIIIGAFFYIGTWPLYGFGQLLDDIKQLKEKALSTEGEQNIW